MAVSERKPWFLKEWRTYRGYSQQRLAEMIDSSKGYISDLETGERRYNQDLLEALANALQCETGDLLNINPEQRDTIEAYNQWKKLRPNQQRQVLRVIDALDDTGSERG